jgi:serine/threonine protein kinase
LVRALSFCTEHFGDTPADRGSLVEYLDVVREQRAGAFDELGNRDQVPNRSRLQPVDHRSDIFSFGLVLYEMLANRTAFTRETPADTMAAILKEDLPSGLPKHAAPALARIVSRCLEKTREMRFQSARDLAFALEMLSGTSASPGLTAD